MAAKSAKGLKQATPGPKHNSEWHAENGNDGRKDTLVYYVSSSRERWGYSTGKDNLWGEKERKAMNRQIDKKLTKQIRIDAGVHQLLKIKAARAGMTIKTLLEGYLADLLAVGGEDL